MGWREFTNKLRHLRGRERFDESLAEEIRLHVEERVEELVATGMPREEALSRARREFGSTARMAEESREAWRVGWVEDLGRDLRYTLRSLRRDRGLAITAILSLALGIGVNTTIFSLAAEFLFSQPSARHPDSLARVEIGGRSHSPMREYRFIRDAHVFEGLAGANEMQEINWRSGDTAQRLFITRVTENYFDVTGIPLAIGRPIQIGERETAVLSHRFWESRLNRDPNAVGRTLVLDGQPVTIVGVLPVTHRTLTGFGYMPDLYLPITNEASSVGFYGRLPSNVSRAAALQRLRSACAELDKVYPDGNHKWASGVTVSPLVGVERLNVGIVRTMAAFFGLMMAAVGLLLLIACANVASLLLARASTRMQEFAIRMSIGAGRSRVIRQMLAESLTLSGLGAAAGLGVNYVLTRLMNRAVIAAPFPLQLAIEPDWRLLSYTTIIAIGCAVVAGILPAIKAAGPGTSPLLKRDEHQVSGHRARLRNALVAGQLAVSALVLIMAILSVRNLMRSAQLDPGFDIRNTIWAQARFVPEKYPNPKQLRAAVWDHLEKLRAVPGVASAAVAVFVPLNDHFASRTSTVYTDSAPGGLQMEHAWNAVGPNYFQTMGIDLIAGREFNAVDREGTQRVVILNEALALKAFGGANPVGRKLRFDRDERSARVVVGVARNSKYSTIGERNRPALYEAYFQGGVRATVQLLIRTAGAPQLLLKPLTTELLRLDPAASVEAKPMSNALAFALMPSRAGALLLGTIGLLGLALASVGLYGVLSYSISRRTREIGLRVAVGAQRNDVLKLVMGESAWIVGTGLCAGLGLAVFVTKPLAKFLVPGLEPSDPLTYLTVAATLTLVHIASALTPALRAVRIDPIAALRYE